MRSRSRLTILVLATLLQACASFQGSPDWPADTTMAQSDPLYQQYVERYYAAPTPAAQQHVRNQFIEIRVGLIDRRFSGFRDQIYTQRVGSAVGVEVATLVLNALGAAMPQESVKTATSGLSAGLIGTKSSIDKNVYFDRTLPALLAQMDSARSQVRERLLAGMTVDVVRYPLMQAAADLDAYFQAGTVSGAISAITTQASVAKQQAEQALRNRLPSPEDLQRELEGRGFVVSRVVQTPTVEQFSQCLDLSGQIDAKALAAMTSFLRSQGVDPAANANALAVSDLMTAPDREAWRVQLLKDSTLGAVIRACGNAR